jgi:hypothetical protein
MIILGYTEPPILIQTEPAFWSKVSHYSDRK